MRIRSIKPEFCISESVGRLTREERLCFILLWMACDDHGITRAHSRALASTLYPYDEDAPGKIEGWLASLSRCGMIRRYTVDGNHYLDIPKWLTHQKIDHPSKSKLPKYEEAREDSRDPREPSGEEQGAGSKGAGSKEQGNEGGAEAPKVDKLPYGQFKSVMLTEEQYKSIFKDRFQNQVEAAIDILDTYVSSTGKKYKNHYSLLKSTKSWVWDEVRKKCKPENQI